MKPTRAAVLGLGMIAAMGLLDSASRAEALTLKAPAICNAIAARESIAFILGEDGRIWYTQVASSGSATLTALAAANPQNPFSAAMGTSLTVAPSLNEGYVNPLTFPTGTVHVGVWIPVPGDAVFQDAPICVNNLSFGSTGDNIMIVVPGLDKRIWHTVLDGDNDGSFADAAVLSSGVGVAATSMWGASVEGAVNDGWPGVIPSGAGAVGVWIPLP